MLSKGCSSLNVVICLLQYQSKKRIVFSNLSSLPSGIEYLDSNLSNNVRASMLSLRCCQIKSAGQLTAHISDCIPFFKGMGYRTKSSSMPSSVTSSANNDNFTPQDGVAIAPIHDALSYHSTASEIAGPSTVASFLINSPTVTAPRRRTLFSKPRLIARRSHDPMKRKNVSGGTSGRGQVRMIVSPNIAICASEPVIPPRFLRCRLRSASMASRFTINFSASSVLNARPPRASSITTIPDIASLIYVALLDICLGTILLEASYITKQQTTMVLNGNAVDYGTRQGVEK